MKWVFKDKTFLVANYPEFCRFYTFFPSFEVLHLPYDSIRTMETLILNEPLKIFYVKATTFPDGVYEAHQKLHAKIPFTRERTYVGISHGSANGSIHYYAGASELNEGELQEHGFPAFILQKGSYQFQDVTEYRTNLKRLAETFHKLLQNPKLDPKGYCVEWYLDENTCRCMVKLID